MAQSQLKNTDNNKCRAHVNARDEGGVAHLPRAWRDSRAWIDAESASRVNVSSASARRYSVAIASFLLPLPSQTARRASQTYDVNFGATRLRSASGDVTAHGRLFTLQKNYAYLVIKIVIDYSDY